MSILQKRISPLWAVGVVGALAVGLFGNVHIVHGGGHGLRVVWKSGFSFSETFVSCDEILGVPWIVAVSRNPSTVKALQREGLVESDEAREQRARRDIEEKMKAAMRDSLPAPSADPAGGNPGAATPAATAAAADPGLPEFDTKAYCAELAKTSGGSFMIEKSCRDMERRAKAKLQKRTAPPRIRAYCGQLASTAGGTYQLLDGCIENEIRAKKDLE